MAETVFSVSQIAAYLEKKLLLDPMLTHISVRGEVTNYSVSSKGQAYFNIKDEAAQVSCVIFNQDIVNQALDNGMMVVVSGEIGYYKPFGRINLIVSQIATEGKGDLYAQFLQVKEKLQAEGLFDDVHKKVLEPYPFSLGVITSAAGAAMHDVINVAKRRNPHVSVKVFPATVQGADAPKSLIAGLEHFNKTRDVDLIVIGRGGGSFEDLFAFNDEALARAVFASDIPVVSAVGHAVDFSITDFVADMRAPTPSAAAELCVPMLDVIVGHIAYYRERYAALLAGTVTQKQADLSLTKLNLERYSPTEQLLDTTARLESLKHGLQVYMQTVLQGATHSLTEAKDKLSALSPLGVLNRGYAYITDGNGNGVTRAKALNVDDAIKATFADGSVAATITKVTDEEEK